MEQANIFYNKYKGHDLEDYEQGNGKYYWRLFTEAMRAIKQDQKDRDESLTIEEFIGWLKVKGDKYYKQKGDYTGEDYLSYSRMSWACRFIAEEIEHKT